MTSKERVLRAFASQEPDRVPINYQAEAAIDGRLKKHFRLKPDDDEGLRLALGVDFRTVGAGYTGPRLHQDIPERGVTVSDWGVHQVWIAHQSGGYWDYCDFPLRDATVEQIAAWPMPNPDHYDYSGVGEACRKQGTYAINGAAGYGDILNGNSMLRGMEQTLMNLVTDDPAELLLADRRMKIQLEITERILAAAAGGVDFLWLGEDLGTQIAPIISREIFLKHIRPRYQWFCDLAKAYQIAVMIHTCGCSSWAYEDFIEMGVNLQDRGSTLDS